MSSISISDFTISNIWTRKARYVTPDKGKQVTPVKQYQANLKKIVTTLQSTGAKLIFATTTPVPNGATGRVHGDEIGYNTAAKEVMQEMGIEVDDLWSVVNPSLATLQQERNVHFTSEGYRVLGAEAASRIERDLPAAQTPLVAVATWRFSSSERSDA